MLRHGLQLQKQRLRDCGMRFLLSKVLCFTSPSLPVCIWGLAISREGVLDLREGQHTGFDTLSSLR